MALRYATIRRIAGYEHNSFRGVVLFKKGKHMRTEKEILERIAAVEKDDWLGTTRGDLIHALNFDAARPFLKEGVKPEDWTTTLVTDEDVKKAMLDYMEFAWGKANNCRGISASRSIDHYKAWLWLLGDDELFQFCEDDYHWYGKPQLKRICEKYGWDYKQWDNGYRGNSEDDQHPIE